MLDDVFTDGDHFVWSHSDTTIKNEEFDEYVAAFMINRAIESITVTTNYRCVHLVISNTENYLCDVQKSSAHKSSLKMRATYFIA